MPCAGVDVGALGAFAACEALVWLATRRILVDVWPPLLSLGPPSGLWSSALRAGFAGAMALERACACDGSRDGNFVRGGESRWQNGEMRMAVEDVGACA